MGEPSFDSADNCEDVQLLPSDTLTKSEGINPVSEEKQDDKDTMLIRNFNNFSWVKKLCVSFELLHWSC